jgi:hypothetical protein
MTARISTGSLVATGVLFLVALPASATTITDCRHQIEALVYATKGVDFKTQKDEDGLVAKLKESWLKLDVMKIDDANQKIGDYKTKLNQLNSQNKILEATGYSDLTNGANGVLYCIANIGK